MTSTTVPYHSITPPVSTFTIEQLTIYFLHDLFPACFLVREIFLTSYRWYDSHELLLEPGHDSCHTKKIFGSKVHSRTLSFSSSRSLCVHLSISQSRRETCKDGNILHANH